MDKRTIAQSLQNIAYFTFKAVEKIDPVTDQILFSITNDYALLSHKTKTDTEVKTLFLSVMWFDIDSDDLEDKITQTENYLLGVLK